MRTRHKQRVYGAWLFLVKSTSNLSYTTCMLHLCGTILYQLKGEKSKFYFEICLCEYLNFGETRTKYINKLDRIQCQACIRRPLVFASALTKVKSRDVIRSPDIRTFELRNEVRIQFLHPDVRINYQKCQKINIFMQKTILFYHTTR